MDKAEAMAKPRLRGCTVSPNTSIGGDGQRNGRHEWSGAGVLGNLPPDHVGGSSYQSATVFTVCRWCGQISGKLWDF